jgi:hypothetical protein
VGPESPSTDVNTQAAFQAAENNYNVALEQINAQEAATLKQQQDAMRGQLAAQGITDSGVIDEEMRKIQDNVSTNFGQQRDAALSQKLSAEQVMATTAEQQSFTAGQTQETQQFQAGQTQETQQFQAGQTQETQQFQAGQTKETQTWQSTQNDFDRALTQQGLDQNEQKMAESAREFDTQQAFTQWATQQGFNEQDSDRAWKAASQAESEAATITQIGATGANQIAAIGAQSTATQANNTQATLLSNKVAYYQGLGALGKSLSVADQATVNSDPIAMAAYQGGIGGQDLATVQANTANLQSYMNARMTGLSNEVGTPQFATDLTNLAQQLGITLPNSVTSALNNVNISPTTGFGTLKAGNTANVAAGMTDATGNAIPAGSYTVSTSANGATVLADASGFSYTVTASNPNHTPATVNLSTTTGFAGIQAGDTAVVPSGMKSLNNTAIPAGSYTVSTDPTGATVLTGANGTAYSVAQTPQPGIGTWQKVGAQTDLTKLTAGSFANVSASSATNPIKDISGNPVPAGEYTVIQTSETRSNGVYDSLQNDYQQVPSQVTYLVDASGNRIEVNDLPTGGVSSGTSASGVSNAFGNVQTSQNTWAQWAGDNKYNPFSTKWAPFGNKNTIANTESGNMLSGHVLGGSVSTGNKDVDNVINYAVNPLSAVTDWISTW